MIKKGRRLYGARYILPSGKQVYLAHRKRSEFFRNGKDTMAEAWRAGTLDWAIDYETAITERALGTKYIGVLIKETGEIWLTHTWCFFDRRRTNFKNYTARGGSLQVYINTRHFRVKSGRLKKL